MEPVTPDTLSSVMEFDHIVRVNADGTVSDTDMSVGDTGSYFDLNVAPDGTDEFELSEGWTLMSGYTGQHGYNGPVMHASEFIGGRMARDILSTPGYYVLLEVQADCNGTEDGCSIEDGCNCEPAGWAVAYKELGE